MRDELDRVIFSYFEAQVKGIPACPLPALQQEATDLGEARDMPRFQKAGRHSAISMRAALALRLAGAAAIAATCIVLAPRRTASPVARGVEVILGDTGIRSTLFSAAEAVTLQTGRSLRKE